MYKCYILIYIGLSDVPDSTGALASNSDSSSINRMYIIYYYIFVLYYYTVTECPSIL